MYETEFKESAQYVLKQNLNRIKGKEIVLCPYGNGGKIIEKIISEDYPELKIKYKVDNYCEGCMTVSEYISQRNENDIIVFGAIASPSSTPLLEEFFTAGINAKDILFVYKDYLLGFRALEKCIVNNCRTVLDVGCGHGIQGHILEDYGKNVTGLTLDNYNVNVLKNTVYSDFLDYNPTQKFDAVWACHIMEHIPNKNQFLMKIKDCLKPGGALFISVPPTNCNTVLTHIHLFNAGYLLCDLLRAGFDCSNAEIKVYGYNLSIVIPEVNFIDEKIIDFEKSMVPVSKCNELYTKYLPENLEMSKNMYGELTFKGDIQELNWKEVNIL